MTIEQAFKEVTGLSVEDGIMTWQERFEKEFKYPEGKFWAYFPEDKVKSFIESEMELKDNEFKKILNSGKTMYEIGRKDDRNRIIEIAENMRWEDDLGTSERSLCINELLFRINEK